MKRLVGPLALTMAFAWLPAIAQTTTYTSGIQNLGNPYNLSNLNVAFKLDDLDGWWVATGYYQSGSGLSLNVSNSQIAADMSSLYNQNAMSNYLEAIYQVNSNSSTSGTPAGMTTTVTGSTINLNFAPPGTPAFSSYVSNAVYITSVGANGAASSDKEQAGGQGAASGSINFSLSSSTVNTSSSVAGSGAAVGVLSQGGAGGTGQNKAPGGAGGAAGEIMGAVADVNLSGYGAGVGGLILTQNGGVGGSGLYGEEESNGGGGGNAAGMYLLFSSVNTGSTIRTYGDNASGIAMLAAGGNGGVGSDHDGYLAIGEPGSNGGGGGWVTSVTDPTGASNSISFRSCSPNAACVGPLNISTTGQNSYGIQLVATGGNGGDSGYITAAGDLTPGVPGQGGSTGVVSFQLFPNVTITTTGTGASAVLLQAQGGTGGDAGSVTQDTGSANTAPGGQGGYGGQIWASLASGVTLTTSGDSADGITARSVGGAGGSVGYAAGGIGVATGANGGNGGASNGIKITSAANITTSGSTARGILAQAISGMGGDGGGTGALFSSNAGGPGVSGSIGDVTITNSGSIRTTGDYSQGILAQSISGGGGAGGSATGSLFYDQGGGGAENSNGGAITVDHTGSIATSGNAAMGIVAQSVGGGGGMGGTAGGVFYSAAGQGAMGGSGGEVTVNLSGAITTSGGLAHGVIAQSVGAGGGVGGNSYSGAAVATYSVGGAAGSGGNGGTVTVAADDLVLTTAGPGAIGLVAQSLGGGGGSGGAAYGTSAGAFLSIAASIGGTAGDGGSASLVRVGIDNSSITTGGGATSSSTPVDAHGVVVQSIGGGGGNGGGASATAVAVAMPIPGESGPQSSFTVTAGYAMGGSGGNGGNGGYAELGIVASTIATAGDGAHGAVVQSIGGGGGNGGDSSVMTASFGYGLKQLMPSDLIQSQNVNLTVAVGGQCSPTASSCIGGNGGNPIFILGEVNGSAGATITTSGQLAIGALVQSIGGGGGNAGVGNSTTSSWGMSNTYGVTLTVGSKGGAGGNGNDASATINTAGSISTSGESAAGLVVQSIGGGGGVGSGSSGSIEGLLNWSQSVGDNGSASVTLNPTVNVGASGGTGGAADRVFVNHYGVISTRGNDSPGVLAQSIGGGGGIGGSAGNPVSGGITTTSGDEDTPPSVTLNPVINVGGNGGPGGSAGSVNINYTGATTTQGDYSQAIVAQSIGGGGGRGSFAYVNNQSQNGMDGLFNFRMNTQLRLGGSGDSASTGVGSTATVVLDGGVISTGAAGTTSNSGFQAYGVLAQSVGGGGGTAADASFDAAGSYALGGSYVGGSSQAFGYMAQVLQDAGSPATAITTTGQAAHGIVAQSVGGGGGVVGVGSSANSGANAVAAESRNVAMGAGSSYGDGGVVTINLPAPSAVQTLSTSGAGAFGMFAQSVGGGGGIFEAAAGGALNLTRFGSSASTGSGNTVSVTAAAHNIVTTGVGAHGIVAQSIGGGGGLVANYNSGQTPALRTDNAPAQGGGVGNGGAVSVSSLQSISVSGAGAFGILAQSVGGGGGIAAINGSVFVGNTGTNEASGNAAGAVNVTVQGPVSASGVNGIGVFAQSSAAGGNGAITVNIGANAPGSVYGGSGAQGVGIALVGGDAANTVTVGSGSWVGAANGAAIRQVGTWGVQMVNVANYGTVYGDTWLNGGGFSAGGQVSGSPPVVAGTLTNFGVIVPTRGVQSVIDGHLVQAASGRIAPDLDFSNLRSGRYLVTGNASLDGSVRPSLITAMPNVFLPVLQVNGAVTGALNAPDSPLFSYTLRQTGGNTDIAITGAHFADARFGLTAHMSGVAGSLQNLFFQGKPLLGGFFAGLDGLAGQGGGQYQAALGQLSPRSAMTLFARAAGDATRIADASMSCPKFGGAGVGVGAQAFLTEGECAYVMTRGQRAMLSGDSDRGRAHMDSAAWQIGGQTALRPGLFLGASAAYQADWFSGRDGVSATGSSVQGAVTLKYQTGPWLLTGAVFGSFGEYDMKRRLSVPGVGGIGGFGGVGSADASFYTAGLRARAAYTFGAENFYVRPYLNLDVVHASNGAFSEGGLGDLGLRIDRGNYTSAILTPAVEVGNRLELSNGMVLRSFLTAGVSLRSNDNWKGYASFNGGWRNQGFGMSAPLDKVAARVGAGIQLFQSEHVDVRIQYDGEYGAETIRHGATASVAYRF